MSLDCRNGQLENVARLQAFADLLPPELLVLIFEHNVGAAPALNRHLIRATHVCRYWRDVALHSPALWTHIALKHPSAIKAFLQRSKALPLRISITTAPALSESRSKNALVHAIQALLAEYGHTFSLKVSLQGSVGYNTIMNSIQASSAPHLEELSIQKLDDYSTSLGTTALPSGISGMPRLRSLKLVGVFLPWFPRGPNALTEIDLTSALPDVRTMLDLLERSPALVRVTIRGSFNPVAERDSRRVVLARLQTLRMHSYPPSGIAAVLPSLVLPSAHTNISIVCPHQQHITFADLIPAYAGADPLRFAVLQDIRRVELWWSPRGDQVLRAYRTSERTCVDGRPAPALEVMINNSLSSAVSYERFCFDWPFGASQVETLVLEIELGLVSSMQWDTILASVPALKALRVAVKGRARTVRMPGDLGLIFALTPGPGPALLCSQLETLVLQGVCSHRPTLDVLRGVVVSRSPAAGGCLRNMKLSTNGPAPWDEPTLSMIREAGVELVVSDVPSGA